jgi:REP element-mobilizing transposase RayT
MTFNPDIHHRRSIRLREYDYSSVGAYFVTVCANGRECLFGDIADDVMRVNDAGRMVYEWWLKLPERFPPVSLDEFVIMPNHFHGIIVFTNHTNDFQNQNQNQGDDKVRPFGTIENSLGRVVQAFKSLTTVEYVKGVNDLNWSPFSGRLWQRNYYERIIRNENEMSAIREYIRFNPSKWSLDKDNPDVS